MAETAEIVGVLETAVEPTEAVSKRIARGRENRYRARTPTSRRLHARALRLMPKGVDSNYRALSPYPIYVARARGPYVTDVDGNRYLDFLLAQGSALLGHAHPHVVRAVRSAIGRGAATCLPAEGSIRLIELVKQRVRSVELMRLTNSGTEATMHAIRVARAYTGKEMIAKAEGGYHGAHDHVLWSCYTTHRALPGPPAAPEPFPHSLGVPKALRDLVAVFQFNDLEGTEAVLRKHRRRLAAVIVEPVMGSVGCLAPRDGYLNDLAKLCREYGLLLILDEVMTGFRISPGGGQELYGVRPDLTTFGKVLGGGLPLGGFGGKREIMEVIVSPDGDVEKEAFHSGTHNGNPIAVAAGTAALEVLGDQRVYRSLARRSEELYGGLQEIADDLRIPVHVEHVRGMGHIHFTDEELRTGRDCLEKGDWGKLAAWCMEGLERGVMFGHPKGEKLFVSIVHGRPEIACALEAAEGAFRAVRQDRAL